MGSEMCIRDSILIGDYALTKDDRETELQRDSNMKTPNVSTTYKAF